ncbi:ABC transporter permease [Oxalobacteraceae bacterium A2-2]
MTALIALVRKDLILYLGNRRALLMHLLLPAMLAAFFGSLFGDDGGGKGGKIDVGLVQLDRSPAGLKIADGLKADSTLRVVELDQQAARDKVRGGKLPVAIVIPAGFAAQAADALFRPDGKPAIPLYYDPSQAAVLAMVKGLLTQHVMQVASAEMMGGGAQSSQRTQRALDQLQQEGGADPARTELATFLTSLKQYQERSAARAQQAGTEGAHGNTAAAAPVGMSMPFTTGEEALSNGPKYNGYAHSFAGMGVQFILFMGVDLGIGVLLARRMGIWSRLLAAPVGLRTVLLGRLLSGALIALGLMCALFAVAVLGFKVHIASVAGFIGVSLCFALMTACFGLLIAAFGGTPEAARGIAVFATLIMVMLGGAWVPSFVFPEWVQQATLVVPTRWAIDGLDAVTWRGLGLDAVLQAMGVQLAFALVFGALALWRFQREE